MDGHQNLVHLIASLHVVYHLSEAEIRWFGQLASCMPQILHKLKRADDYMESEEVVHSGYIILSNCTTKGDCTLCVI